MFVSLSTFESARDNRPVRKNCTFSAWIRSLTTFRVRPVADKRDLPAWSPAIFREGATRCKSAVLALGALVLDYDDGTPISEAQDCWKGWFHVIHTSYSHTEAHHKFRLILPFEHPTPPTHWARIWHWAEQRTGRTIDPSCKDPSRIYFVPAIAHPEAPHHSQVWDEPSGLLNLGDGSELPLTPEERQAQALQERTIAIQHTVGRAGVNRDLYEIRSRLKVDPDLRERAALKLGARLMGAGPNRRAEDILCPKCGQHSVWFLIEPQRSHGAQCQHKNSCGWFGWLDELGGAT